MIVGLLGAAGYDRTDDPAAADVVLVNTCSVRDHAEQRVLSRMGEPSGQSIGAIQADCRSDVRR